MSPTALRALTSAREAAGTAWDAAALAWECLIVAVLTWWDTRDCPAEDGEDGFYDA